MVEKHRITKPSSNWRVWVINDLTRYVRRRSIGVCCLIPVFLQDLFKSTTNLELDDTSNVKEQTAAGKQPRDGHVPQVQLDGKAIGTEVLDEANAGLGARLDVL
jgi:hypothetical protein